MKEIKELSKIKKLAYAEAKKLIRNATEQEKGKLKITKVNPENSMECIYGQMTGYCGNARAIELIKRCAKNVFIPNDLVKHNEGKSNRLSEAFLLNGSPVGMDRGGFFGFKYFSPIEVFIAKASKQEVKDLARYIKTGIKP